jgi:hypothetical protein
VVTHIGRRVTTLIPFLHDVALNLTGVVVLHILLPKTSQYLFTFVAGRETSKNELHNLAWIGVESVELGNPPDNIARNTLGVGCTHSSDFEAVGRILKKYLSACLDLNSIHHCEVSTRGNLTTIGCIFLILESWTKIKFPETLLGPATVVSPARVSYLFEIEILGFSLLSTFPTLAVLLG